MEKTCKINLHRYYNQDRIKNTYDITAEVNNQLCISQKTNKNLINTVPGYEGISHIRIKEMGKNNIKEIMKQCTLCRTKLHRPEIV
jgi:hypothetical protein